MTKQNNGWISVDERLPEVETPVIGLCNILDLQIVLIVSREVADGEYYWIAINQNGPDYDNAIDVTHWQPLPQPPTITMPSQFESVGVNLIAQERQRQQSEKGFTLNSDTQYANDELVKAAMCYLKAQSQHAVMPGTWPWGENHWKPKDRKRNLIKAGALIAAEIDRLHNTTP